MFVTLQNSISVQNTDMSFQIKIRKLRLNPHNPKSFWKIKYSTPIAFQLFEEPKTLLLALLPSTLFKFDKSAAFSVLSTGTLCLLPISILGASAGTIRAVPDTVKKVPGLAPVLFLSVFLTTVFCLAKWGKTNAFSSIGKMKADKATKSFPTYRILTFEVW